MCVVKSLYCCFSFVLGFGLRGPGGGFLDLVVVHFTNSLLCISAQQVFYVIEGAVNLKVHDTTLVLVTGAMFLVPRGKPLPTPQHHTN
jgi:hypothetical protein